MALIHDCTVCKARSAFNVNGQQFDHAGRKYSLGFCQNCGLPNYCASDDNGASWQILYPKADESTPIGCPADVRDNFAEAISSRNVGNYRAAVLMARGALQACMRDLGATESTLQREIDDLAGQHRLPASIRDWAHEVRVGANLAAHPKPNSEVGPEDADELIALAESIFEYLYTIPANVQARRARLTSTS